MSSTDYLQLAMAVATGLGSLFGLLKMGLENYFKKAKELEELRRHNNDTAIADLKDTTKSLQASLKLAQDDMQKIRLVIVQSGAKIESLSAKYEELRLEMHPLIEALKRKVRPQGKSTEVKDLGQNFYRVEKKPGTKE